MIEKMPFQLGIDERPAVSQGNEPQDWRAGLPELSNDIVTLREIRVSDAHALFAMLSTEAVGRFMSAPPPSVDAFIRFIEWTLSERAVGRYLCFAVVPAGYDVPVGILQMRQVQPSFAIAEWGAALGAAFWGTGLFPAAARLLIDFAFDQIGVYRLEARASVKNGRANGAARKLGAAPEGVLRRGVVCHGEFQDQLMWSILAEDWQALKQVQAERVH
jgi:[ribosomal protein S5]-alanine N-acetyltransferase